MSTSIQSKVLVKHRKALKTAHLGSSPNSTTWKQSGFEHIPLPWTLIASCEMNVMTVFHKIIMRISWDNECFELGRKHSTWWWVKFSWWQKEHLVAVLRSISYLRDVRTKDSGLVDQASLLTQSFRSISISGFLGQSLAFSSRYRKKI